MKASKNSFPSIGYDLGPKFESEMHFLLTKVDIFQNFHKELWWIMIDPSPACQDTTFKVSWTS